MTDAPGEPTELADQAHVSIRVTVRGATATEVIQRTARLVEVFDAEVETYGATEAVVVTDFDTLEELESHLAEVYAADEEG